MASRIGKAKHKKDNHDFIEGYKAMELKNRKKPHHWKISRRVSRFDNDEIFMMTDGGEGYGSSEIGINKQKIKINDDDYFDGSKDGN